MIVGLLFLRTHIESMQGGTGSNDKLDELHRNVRQVVENVGHLVTKNQVGTFANVAHLG